MKDAFLSSDRYFKFVATIHTAAGSIGSVTEASGRAVSSVAQELGIGRVCAEMRRTSAGEQAEEKLMIDAVLFNAEASEDDVIKRVFCSRKVDELILYIYPAVGRQWSDEDKKTLNFIACNMATAFDRARMTELLNEAQFRDAMTGLYNADGLIKQGNRIINMGHGIEYTAFYFNLTNFKYVNKVVAYQGGDKVLVIYTKKLLDFLEDDEIVGRLGGDNFVAMIRNERAEAFLKFISSIEVLIENNNDLHQFVFGATVGGMHLDKDTDNMGRVMMSVSSAYQMAKEVLHRPVVYCTPDMMMKLVQGKEILMKFPAAVANMEFMVYYQPKVDAITGKLEGAEALVRWKQGSAVIPPAQFIPMLERNGEICVLDFYVFETVCRNMKKWKEEGRNLFCISSNFSRWHLKDADFINHVVRIADEYGIDHRLLEIEVTETTDVDEYNTLLGYVKALKEHGFSVSIDDFGTGYSSLNMLKEIPADVLKLDKSMVDHSGNSENDKIMLKHIVSLAYDMSIKVLAEGVETAEQCEFLKSIGCTMIQGYFFDRPLMINEFEKRMDKGGYGLR